MKGIVFVEFLEMVEDDLGLDVADRMIEGADIQNKGAFTSVGTYDHTDLISLVVSLSQVTELPISALIKTFGSYLFGRLGSLYPQFFEGVDSAIDFLPSVESFIHVEVQKLYPDAELPMFDCDAINGDVFQMTYRSKRPFADLAEGMIEACIEHFKDPLQLHREDLGQQNGTEARFILTPVEAQTSPQKQEACPS